MKTVLLAMIPVALCLAACTPPNAAPKGAREFLLWSMDQHKALKSYSSTCAWNLDSGSGMSPTTGATRTINYQAPNLFQVVATRPVGGSQTSVSDGKKLVEYNTMGIPGQSYDAPDSIADAKSMQMQHPMFCGSLLYKFFGGASKISDLADEAKSPISDGGEKALPAGGKARLIKFYGTGMYGNVQALIDEKTGMVDRIDYDDAGLMELMKQSGRAIPGNGLKTSEVYSKIEINPSLAASLFVAQPPSGAQIQDMSAAAADNPHPPVAFGKPAPDFSVTTLDGKTVSLSSLRGKPVLLDFWATWCGPCRMSLPHTDSLAAQHGHEITVIPISDEEVAKISAFVKENKYTFAPYRDPSDTAAKLYNVVSIPTFVLIDARGNLVDYASGYGGPEPLRQMLAKVGVKV